jgi:phosphoribosylaminoimidazole (AIR) synthetase
MTIQIRDLKVGDKVAVWGTSMFPTRGYTVTKVDKMKAVLSRGDKYERVFSVKRGCELATPTRTYVERYASIISEADAELQAQAHTKRQNITSAYRAVEGAAHSNSIETLRTAMAALEALLVAA